MKLRFPRNFVWGTAISAFQTEMGSSDSSVFTGTDWYQWTHSEEIRKKGLVSSDLPERGDGFWDLYKEDMDNAARLGTNSIRLSIEWGRLFPESTEDIACSVTRNRSGGIVEVIMDRRSMEMMSSQAKTDVVNHYREMLSYARSVGLSVFLTLYHWPLPSWLHDPVETYRNGEDSSRKGWLSENTIIEFGKYADFVARTFGDLVNLWETINEPEVIALNGYFFGSTLGFPPGISDIGLAMRVEKNLAYAHTVAYKSIKRHCPELPVGIGTAPPYFTPADDSLASSRAADYARYLNNEWILNASLYGNFDLNMDMVCDEREEGFSGADFIGIDYYMRIRIKRPADAPPENTLDFEMLPCEECSDFEWDIYPEGIRHVAKWIFEKYRLPVYILENGIADEKDARRGKFIMDHLLSLQRAIDLDGIPVRGYYHWSLIDNFEWAKGFSMRFGLYEVDYSSRKRKMRNSAEIFRKICKGEDVEIE